MNISTEISNWNAHVYVYVYKHMFQKINMERNKSPHLLETRETFLTCHIISLPNNSLWPLFTELRTPYLKSINLHFISAISSNVLCLFCKVTILLRTYCTFCSTVGAVKTIEINLFNLFTAWLISVSILQTFK